MSEKGALTTVWAGVETAAGAETGAAAVCAAADGLPALDFAGVRVPDSDFFFYAFQQVGGRRQVGGVGDADQNHLQRVDRHRRGLHLVHSLDQHLPDFGKNGY